MPRAGVGKSPMIRRRRAREDRVCRCRMLETQVAAFREGRRPAAGNGVPDHVAGAHGRVRRAIAASRLSQVACAQWRIPHELPKRICGRSWHCPYSSARLPAQDAKVMRRGMTHHSPVLQLRGPSPRPLRQVRQCHSPPDAGRQKLRPPQVAQGQMADLRDRPECRRAS
jgi:hypothetical protein